MKEKNSVKSSVIRSVLTEVYAADKTTGQAILSGRIYEIIQKGINRRNDAVAQYDKASRQDLVEKEQQEVAILHDFIPPTLSDTAINDILDQIIREHGITPVLEGQNPGPLVGQLFKEFSARTGPDVSVDRKHLKTRIDAKLKAKPT